jgi:hypothetical protein
MIYTSRNSKILVNVAGVTIDTQSWDKFSGAGRTADTSNYPAGGMVPSVPVQGVTKRNPCTIERAWDDVLIGAQFDLDGAVNGPISVSVTPLQNRTTPGPAKRTFTGILKEVNPPDSDSTSSTVQMLSIVCELAEVMST